MGNNPIFPTTKGILRKLGGDKISGKVLTWDGDTSNQVMFGATPAVKIYDKFVELDNIAGVTLTSDQHDVFIPKKDFLAHRVGETLGFEQAVIQIEEGYAFVYFAIPADLPDETIDQLGDLEEGVYYGLTSETKQISKLHFAETIVPIDPKFIPPVDSLTINGTDGKQYKLTVNNGAISVAEVV